MDKDYLEALRSELGLESDEPLIFFRNDADGENWHFEIESEKFGRLVCSYYPAKALQTIRDYFESSLSEHSKKSESIELILAYAEEIFPKHIYALFKDTIRQAVHEIISRTRWELRGTTHTLQPTAKGKKPAYVELADRVLRPAKEAALVRLGLPSTGRMPELSEMQKKEIPKFYKERLADSQKVKEFYDTEFKRFDEAWRKDGYKWEVWAGTWLIRAKVKFPSLRMDYLALFSSLDRPSAAEVTRQWLAKRLGCSPSYIEKLI